MSSRDRHRDLTMKEAEDILEEARSKDFWCVDIEYDNRDYLQDAIDVVYNSIEGNQYEVDYMENQNGTRLMVRCVPCSKELLSFDPFYTHEKGKPHNKVRQQNLAPRDPNLQGVLKRQPLNISKGIFPKKTLEEHVDFCKEPILGIQFVYKEVIAGKERYTCCLCCREENVVSLRKRKMFKHLKSDSHNLLYMEVKFAYRKGRSSQFMDDVMAIEEMEGKIHAPIIDFSKQYLAQLGPAHARRSRSKEKEKRWRRSDSRSSSSDREGSRKKLRQFSPILSIKQEITPENSPQPPAPLFLPLPVLPLIVDNYTQTETGELQPSITERTNLLKRREALEILHSDEEMQTLLHQTLSACNNMLIKYFRRKNVICFNEKGDIVAEAAGCAENLVKHLQCLQVV